MAPRPAICKPYSAGAVGTLRYYRETALRAPQFPFGDLAVTDASTDDQARMMARSPLANRDLDDGGTVQ